MNRASGESDAKRDLYIGEDLAAALCAGQELTTEGETGKKRRGRKSKWVCEACGQKKPKKVPAATTRGKAKTENNNENGVANFGPGKDSHTTSTDGGRGTLCLLERENTLP